MTGVTPVEFWMGLRFKRGDARVLRNLVGRLRSLGPKAADHISLFDKAIESIEDGEPLVVRCSDPSEAYAMAAQFTAYGIAEPEVQDFSEAHRRA